MRWKKMLVSSQKERDAHWEYEYEVRKANVCGAATDHVIFTVNTIVP